MSPCGHGQSQVWSACRCVCQQENPTLKRDNRCVAARAACGVCEVILQQKASTHTLPTGAHFTRCLKCMVARSERQVHMYMCMHMHMCMLGGVCRCACVFEKTFKCCGGEAGGGRGRG